jgi:hypothetical protein
MTDNLKLIKYTNGSLSSAIRSAKMRMDAMGKSIRAAERRMNNDIEDIYDRTHPDRINSLHTGEKTVINVSLRGEIVAINGLEETVDVDVIVPGNMVCRFDGVPIECVVTMIEEK